MSEYKSLEHYALRQRKKPLVDPQSLEAEAFCNVLKYAILKRHPQEKDYQTKINQRKTLLTS